MLYVQPWRMTSSMSSIHMDDIDSEEIDALDGLDMRIQ